MHPITKVHQRVRRQIENDQISELDEDIEGFNVQAGDIDIMLAMLTATACVKSKLKHRKKLYRQVKAELKSRGLWESGILWGLK